MECLLPEILDPQFIKRYDKFDIKDPGYVKCAQDHLQCVRHKGYEAAMQLNTYKPTFLSYHEYMPTEHKANVLKTPLL